MEKLLKFGHVRGGKTSTPVVLTAADAYVANSASFVVIAAAGTATKVAASGTTIFGWAETEVVASVVAGTPCNVIIDPSAVYRIPVVAGTYTPAKYLGRGCDIVLSGNIQGADLTAHTDDVLLIVGGDATLNYVDVMVVPAVRVAATLGAGE